jgi:predicted transcriptional regulator
MTLTRHERKARLPFGAAVAVARELGCSKALVSDVLADKAGNTRLTHRIKVLLARKARTRVAEMFSAQVGQQAVDYEPATHQMHDAA